MGERVGRLKRYLRKHRNVIAWLAMCAFLLGGVYRVEMLGARTDRALCEAVVNTRAATRGIWEGARSLALMQARNQTNRDAIRAFFDEILAPYPPLQCVDRKPVPLAASSLVLVSFRQLPCIPSLPFTCPPPPSDPPPQPPAAGDDPPQMDSVFIDRRFRRNIVIGWGTARDEEGIVRYRLYRDSILRASTGPRARRARFWFPCGFHVYAVEAVDTSGQKDALATGAIRRC
jgi:hypothetical protein